MPLQSGALLTQVSRQNLIIKSFTLFTDAQNVYFGSTVRAKALVYPLKGASIPCAEWTSIQDLFRSWTGWGTWPIFIEIAIKKSSKNDGEESSSTWIQSADRPEIEFKVARDVIRIRENQQNLRILWRHRQLWTRFPGDRIIFRCYFWLFFVIFWALSDTAILIKICQVRHWDRRERWESCFARHP